MTYEEEMLEIERTRLTMEKKRDQHASIRFLLGGVLLAASTTFASLYVNHQQNKRALVSSERQWVVPMLLEIEPTEFDLRSERIEALLNMDLTPPIHSYLTGERLATSIAKNNYEKKKEEEVVARKEQAEQKMLAQEAEERAAEAKKLVQLERQRIAEEEARIARAAENAAKQRAITAEKARQEVVLKEVKNITRRIKMF